jgi:hypothetical protein
MKPDFKEAAEKAFEKECESNMNFWLPREPEDEEVRYWKEIYVNGANHGYSEAMKEQRWIPVSERLPDINCSCAVYTKKREVLIMSYHMPGDVYKRDFHCWLFGSWKNQSHNVTHWIQLPSPPSFTEQEQSTKEDNG